MGHPDDAPACAELAPVIELAGESLALLRERAAFWPRRATLLVADAHFGKAASFRAQGIAVPRGTTTESLARLDAALGRTGARRIVFLGDFLHAKRGRSPGTLDALAAWRERHPALDLVLVRGNHDRHAGDPPAALRISVVSEPLLEAPFALCHEPREADSAYVLAGHLHPSLRLRGRANEALRLPCFWFGERHGVLPAFGSFTGTHPVRRAARDRAFVVAGDRVLAA